MSTRFLSTPLRTVCIYALAFVLLALLESSRITPWLERLAPDLPPAAQAATLVNTLAKKTGLASLAEAETRLLTQGLLLANADRTLGAVPMPTQPTFAHSVAAPPVAVPPAAVPPAAVPPAAVPPAMSVPPAVLTNPTPSSVIPDPTQPAPIATATKTLPAKTRVLVVGDSMIMEGLGPVIQRTLRKRTDVEVTREGKYSTGLTRIDQLDWPAYLKTLLKKHQPDVIIVCLGANDPQDIIDGNKKRHIAGTESWQILYLARAQAFADVALSEGASLIWMGLPIMGKDPYDQRIRLLSDLQRQACEKKPGCTFIDNRKTLADAAGQYTTFATDAQGRHVRLRYKDKIHVTEDGGAILTARLIAPFETVVKARPKGTDSTQGAEAPIKLSNAKAPIALAEETVATFRLAGPQAESPTPSPQGEAPTLSPQTERVPAATPPAELSAPPALRPQALLYTTRLFSTYEGGDTQYYAFVPGQLYKDERFPVVYLLHGAGGSAEDWKKNAGNLLRELVNRLGLVVVIPPGTAYGWYADSRSNPQKRIESYMMRDLMPHVETHLPVLPQRGIMGFSMGGHGALSLGLRNLGLFASISSMSGILDITRHPRQWHLSEVFGPLTTQRAQWEAHAPFGIINTLNAAQSTTIPPLLITIGQSDELALDENRLFRNRLNHLKIRHQYRETPGRHDWNYALKELPLHLEFHARNLAAGKKHEVE